jgi:hypothetical protein
LKSEGWKGKELTRKVNEALIDTVANRRVACAAAILELANQGQVPDSVEIRKKGATLRFVKADASQSEKDEAAYAAIVAAEEAKAKAEAVRAKFAAAAKALNLAPEAIEALALILA